MIVGVRISCLSERLLWVFGECVGAACGRVWCGFAGIELCVWGDWCEFLGSERMLCVGAFGVGLWGVSVFCVWESWFGFVGIVCVLCVRAFCVGFWGVCWCCVWESLLWVCGE